MEWAKADPVSWCNRILGSNFWGLQEQIVESVRDNRYTSVWACHAPGKTYTAAAAILWWLYTHAPSKVITTAPTGRQVYSLLWAEIRTAHARAEKRGFPLGGSPLRTRLEIAPDWYAEGFATSEWDPERVAGYHAPSILVVVDEASGVPDGIFDALEGLMSSGEARQLRLGNPTRSSGTFYESSKNPTVKGIHIPAWVTPNFTELGISREDILAGTWSAKAAGRGLPRDYLLNPLWVAERAQSWGTDSPLWQVRVEARFPVEGEGDDRVIASSWTMNAQQREFTDDAANAPIEIGVDVGRYGADESVITARAGRAALREKATRRGDLMQTTGIIVQEAGSLGWDRVEKIKLDVIGLGAGPVDRLRELQSEGVIPGHVEIIAVNVGRGARDKKRFATLRDEVWWEMRELMQSGQVGGPALTDEAVRELSEPRYTVASDGRIKVEGKDSLRRPDRLGRSPDRADSWILAYVDCPDERPRITPRIRRLGR